MRCHSEHEVPQSGLTVCLQKSALIPVITLQRPDDAVPLTRALRQAGLQVFEFTLRTPAGLPAIQAVRKAFPDACIGAGTVRDIKDYHAAVAAGADFVVSPGSTPDLLDYGVTAAVPLLPGVATLSELMLGYERGYRTFKFFPAGLAGGVDMLRAFCGPFPDVQFVPTGGITGNNAGDYLAMPAVKAVGGTWLIPDALLAKQDWEAIHDHAKACRDQLKY